MGRRVITIGVVCAGMLVGAGGASADTVTFGSQFQGAIGSALFDGGAGTIVNTSLPAPLNVASPTDGTVIEWRFSSQPNSFTPQVIRPLGGDLYTLAVAGPPQVGTGVGNILGPFPLNLPIKKGDLFGVAGGNNARFGVINHPGGSYAYFVPPLDTGPGRPRDYGGPSPAEYAISATVRYCLVPSLKGKKPKAAKKALKAADCAFGGKKKSKKRRKKKRVVGQSVAPGTSISDIAPVAIKVSRPKS